MHVSYTCYSYNEKLMSFPTLKVGKTLIYRTLLKGKVHFNIRKVQVLLS